VKLSILKPLSWIFSWPREYPFGILAIWFLLPALSLGHLSEGHAQDIAILKSADIAAYNRATLTFTQHLPANTTVREFNLEGNMAEGRKIARKLRASNAQVILAIGLKAALATKLEIFDIPVIFCMVLNPEKYSLPAQNMTGIGLTIPISHQLKTFQTIFPKLKKIGVVFDPSKSGDLIPQARIQAKKHGLTLIARSVTSEREVPDTLRAITKSIDALWLLPDSTVLNEESLEFLLSTTLESNIPLFGFSSGLVRSGALASVFIKYEDIGRQAADLATQLLKGTAIPTKIIVPLDHVRLSLNLKTAEFLHLLLPPHVVGQADETY
jgi:putative ABC transport system substrate-binding protein